MKYVVKTNNQFLADLPRYAGITTEDAREAADYILENSQSELEEEYDEMLDECYGDINIFGIEYSTSVALYRVDKVAYDCGMNDYQDGRAEDMKYEIERMDDGEEETYYDYTITAVEEEEEETKTAI